MMTAMPERFLDTESSFDGWEEKFDCYLGQEKGIDWLVEVKCYESNTNNQQIGGTGGISSNIIPPNSPKGGPGVKNPPSDQGSFSTKLCFSCLLGAILLFVR